MSASVLLILSATATFGAEQGRRQWFKSLMMPGTQNSCCDVADCGRTTARWQRDGWWADVRGKWQPIPSESVLSGPKSLDGEAYVCVGDPMDDDAHRIGQRVYCFVPPDLGS